MKMLAVATDNFAFYHDLVRRLKRRGVSFVSLGLDDPVPAVVGALITTEAERDEVNFESIFTVAYEGGGGETGEREAARALDMAVDRALAHLDGADEIGLLVVGVDPGKRPGLAVMGDARLLKKYQAPSPEEVGLQVRRMVETYRPGKVLVRLGDGAPTQRDRIINSIRAANEGLVEGGEGLSLELADETNSSDAPHGSDEEAALRIALTPGRPVTGGRDVLPSPGEIREVQRLSRQVSGGEVTISRELAGKVLTGSLDITEAIRLQKMRD